MKKHLLLIAFVVVGATFAGCDQYAARHGIGSMDFDLPACRKFEAANWKGDDAQLWYTTRPMRPGEQPETHVYQSSTLFGIFEGKVTFIEHACTGANVPTEQ